jgi:hypothetical protein
MVLAAALTPDLHVMRPSRSQSKLIITCTEVKYVNYATLKHGLIQFPEDGYCCLRCREPRSTQRNAFVHSVTTACTVLPLHAR